MSNNINKWKNQEIENQAKNKLANMTTQEIKEKAKKFKNASIFLFSIICFCGAVGLIMFASICIINIDGFKDNLFTYTLLILIFASLLFFSIYKIVITSKKSDNELVLTAIKNELKRTSSTISQEHILHKMTDGAFTTTKSINIATTDLSKSKLLIDSNHKLFIYQNGNEVSNPYNFSDLINYEVYENGSSTLKGRAGSALVGGAFFGLPGLIIGGSMSRKLNQKCNQLKLVIRLNDSNLTQIILSYVDNISIDKSSSTYKSLKENLQSVCSELEYIMNSKTLQESASIQTYNLNNNSSLKTQIKELKEMLDEGLITDEEFEQKKKQLLKL